MPPSHTSSGKSADERSGGRVSRRRTKYIDSDTDSDMVGKGEKRSHNRSEGRPPVSTAGKGHAWSGTTELHINLQVEVGDRKFYLHKFPVLSKSGKLNRLIFELRNTRKDRISLSDIPGGSQAFELLAKYLYGGKVNLTPLNAATIRCAAEYLEMTDTLGDRNLVTMAEYYLNYYVMDSWRDCITVLKSCSELTPWAEDLEIVRRCADAIAHKCSNDPPYEARWNGSSSSTKARDWWFDDVCTLSIEFFSKVVHALSGKGQGLVAAAVGYYAEKWLQLTRGSDMSTTLKLTKEESSQAASFVAFTGFNQDIVAKDTTQAQHKNRAILQGIVNLLPPQLDSMSVKFLLKLLRVACLVNAGPLCKTDLAKRIGSQLEKVSLVDLLIPASGESTYDVDVVQQIVEFYIQDQSYGNSPPLSPRSSVSESSLSGASSRTSSSNSSRRSLSSASSSNLSRSLSGSSLSGSSLSDSSFSASSLTSGSSVTTDSRSGRSVSGSSDSSSSSGRSSDTGSSITRSSSDLSSRRSSSSSSFRSTSNSETTESSRSSHTSGDSSSSSSGLSSDESVKLEKKPFYAITESPRNRKSQLPPRTANFKVAQLLEAYLEEIAKDSTLALEKFIALAELFTEFPRDSDDSIYRAIDGFLRAHPSLTEVERKNLCRVMDTGALSLGASVHAASNERLPVRVVVQLLFSEQIKIRNELAGNDVINEKDLGDHLPSFSSTTSTTSSSESSSDATSTTTTSSSSTSSSSSSASDSTSTNSKSRSPSISSASELNQAIARTKSMARPPSIARSPSVASAVSSQLLGGLSIKETLRFVLAEIESLRKSVQEIETVKSRLSLMDTLQQEMQNLSTKFQEMSHDYVGMSQQVEELTKGSKSKDKSGWTSGWKRVAKSFQSKDSQEHPKPETPPVAPAKLAPAKLAPPKLQIPDVPALPALRTSKSDNLHPKTPRADSTLQTKNARADSLPVTKASKGDSNLLPKTPKGDPLPIGSKIPRAESLPIPKTANVAGMCPKTPRGSTVGNLSGPLRKELVGAQTPRPSMIGAFSGPMKVKELEIQTPRESFKVAQETPRSVTPTLRRLDKDMGLETSPFFKDRRKEDYNMTGQRSQHVEDVHRRRIRSRSTSPDYVPPPRHHKDPDTVSVTSTSSYSSRSTAASSVSGLSRHRYRARGSRDRSTSKSGSLEQLRHRHSSTHKSERIAGHRRHVGVGSEEQHGVSHRKHRQKEGSEHHSTSHHSGQNGQSYKDNVSVDSHPRSHHSGQNGQSYKDHVSVDSHPRPSIKDIYPGPPSQHSSHHRYKDGSVASYHTKDGSEHHSSHRGGHRKDRY